MANPVKHGVLAKLSRSGTFHWRSAALWQDRLEIFRGDQLTWNIPLDGVAVVTNPKRKWSFYIQHPTRRSYLLLAPNLEDAVAWVNALRSLVLGGGYPNAATLEALELTGIIEPSAPKRNPFRPTQTFDPEWPDADDGRPVADADALSGDEAPPQQLSTPGPAADIPARPLSISEDARTEEPLVSEHTENDATSASAADATADDASQHSDEMSGRGRVRSSVHNPFVADLETVAGTPPQAGLAGGIGMGMGMDPPTPSTPAGSEAASEVPATPSNTSMSASTATPGAEGANEAVFMQDMADSGLGVKSTNPFARPGTVAALPFGGRRIANANVTRTRLMTPPAPANDNKRMSKSENMTGKKELDDLQDMIRASDASKGAGAGAQGDAAGNSPTTARITSTPTSSPAVGDIIAGTKQEKRGSSPVTLNFKAPAAAAPAAEQPGLMMNLLGQLGNLTGLTDDGSHGKSVRQSIMMMGRATKATVAPSAAPPIEVFEITEHVKRPSIPTPTLKEDRDNVAWEMYTSELSYVNTLEKVIQEFIVPLRATKVINGEELRAIFANIELLASVGVSFLTSLAGRLGAWTNTACVGDVFIDQIPYFKNMYAEYLKKFDSMRTACDQARVNNENFARFLLQSQQANNGCDLFFYLMAPVQRIPRYLLLLKDLIKKTQPTHPDYEKLSQAFDRMDETAKHVNANTNTSGTLAIDANQIIFSEYLSTPHRYIVWESRLSIRAPHVQTVGVLFNDILVIGVKGVERFTAHAEFNLTTTWVEDLRDTDPQAEKEAFELYTPRSSHFVYADSSDHKLSWIRSIEKAIRDLLNKGKEGEPNASLEDRQGTFFENGLIYEGGLMNGQRYGNGTLILKNQNRYAGEFVGDSRVGYGTFTWKNGAVYTGFFEDDQPHGVGVLTGAEGGRYEGEWRFGRRHGSGRLTQTGGVYEGSWDNDRMNGQGVLTCTNGAAYEGDWHAGQRHGEGQQTYSDHSTYVGGWFHGRPAGNGTRTYPDGTVYTGAWREGSRQGQGTLTTKYGMSYDGLWARDRYHIKGRLQYPDGSVYEGAFQHGMRHGMGAWTAPWGEAFEGMWQDDRRHGRGKWQGPAGEVFEGEFVNDKREGEGSLTTPWNIKYTGQWHNDRRNGVGTTFYADGATYAGQFKDDERHGHGVYLDAAGVEYVGGWGHDQRSGVGGETLPNGVKYEGGWLSDRKHGQGVLTANGVRFEGEWKNGARHGPGRFLYKEKTTYACMFSEGLLVPGDSDCVTDTDLPEVGGPWVEQ